MKLIKECPLLAGVVIVSILISILSFAFKDTVYGRYKETESYDTPVLALFFKGASEGVFPWSENESFEGEAALTEDGSEALETAEADEAVFEADIASDDGTYAEEVSANDVSGNSEPETYEFTEVDDDYFNDALFIGDSRTVGLSEYCEELDTRAEFYAKTSLTIYDVLTKEFIKTDNGKITVEEALSQRQFAKIYIMLGLNEIGTGTVETFCEAYSGVLDKIRELEPDAIIYIQGIMHVTEKKSSADKYFNNENINLRNAALSELANNRDIFYIDMNEAVDDENGNLLAELSFDDVHLRASSYERWHQYLLSNAIVKE